MTGEGELTSAIESLRRELQAAIEQGRGQPLRFHLSPIELTLQVAVKKDATGKISGWKIIELGGSVRSEDTQTLKLTLDPGWLDPTTGTYRTRDQFTIASQSDDDPGIGPQPPVRH